MFWSALCYSVCPESGRPQDHETGAAVGGCIGECVFIQECVALSGIPSGIKIGIDRHQRNHTCPQERRITMFGRMFMQLKRIIGKFTIAGGGSDRVNLRNQCLITSEFSYFGNVDAAMIRNLDQAGAYLETTKRIPVGETIRLRFPLHYLDPAVEVQGIVTYIGPDGVGVKFCDGRHD